MKIKYLSIKIAFWVLCFCTNNKTVSAQVFSAKNIKLYDYFNRFFIQEIYIEVSGLPVKMDTSFGLEKIQLTLHHKRVSDLKIQLQSPDGNTVWISNRNGGTAGENYLNTSFSQFGKNGLVNNAAAPFTGNYTPSGELSYFANGSNPNGNWKLLIEDLQTGIEGFLDSVSIRFGSKPAFIRQVQHCSITKPELCSCNTNGNCTLLPDLVILPCFSKNQWTEFAWNDPAYPGQLKITAAIANIGLGPLEIISDSLAGEPFKNKRFNVYQNIYTKQGNQFIQKARQAGTIYFDSTAGHQHYHVDDWVAFRLVKKEKGKRTVISNGNKVSYCLFTTGMLSERDSSSIVNGVQYGSKMANYGLGNYFTCNLGKQGITVGGYDYYGMMYEGQYLRLPKGLKSGNYVLEIEIDPHHWYQESNKKNNVFSMPVTISKQNL